VIVKVTFNMFRVELGRGPGCVRRV